MRTFFKWGWLLSLGSIIGGMTYVKCKFVCGISITWNCFGEFILILMLQCMSAYMWHSVRNHKSPHLWFSVLFCSHTWLMCMCVPLNICLCTWYLHNRHVCKAAGIWQWPSFECCSDICVFGDAVKPILMFRIKGKTGTHAVCCQKAVLATETCQQAGESEKAENPPTLFDFYGHITNRLIYRTKGYKSLRTLYVKTRYMDSVIHTFDVCCTTMATWWQDRGTFKNYLACSTVLGTCSSVEKWD